MDGHAGKDLIVKVPCGTLVWKLPSAASGTEKSEDDEEEEAANDVDGELEQAIDHSDDLELNWRWKLNLEDDGSEKAEPISGRRRTRRGPDARRAAIYSLQSGSRRIGQSEFCNLGAANSAFRATRRTR